MTTVIILLLVGAALLALETVLPGLIAGSIGMICLIAGVVTAYSEFGARGGNLVLTITLVGLLIGWLLYLKYFPESRIARLFISQRTIGNVEAEQTALLGQTGKALTVLRPSGTALINGRRVDVVTEGGLIEPGTPVKVVAVEGLRTVVRAV
jgi:membrane-bound serine protease (ClpP class)